MKLLPELELASTGNTLENAPKCAAFKCKWRPSHGTEDFPCGVPVTGAYISRNYGVPRHGISVAHFVKHVVSSG